MHNIAVTLTFHSAFSAITATAPPANQNQFSKTSESECLPF